MLRKLIGILLPSLSFAAPYGYNFLKLNVTPSQAIYGAAFTAVAGRSAFAVNPAVLPFDNGVSVSLNSYLDGVKFGQLSFKVHSTGIYLKFLNSGKIPRIDGSGVYQGDFSVNFVDAGFARTVLQSGERLTVGVAGDFVFQQIYDDFSAGAALSAGVFYRPSLKIPGELNIGASLRNVGVELKKFDQSDGSKMPIQLLAAANWRISDGTGVGLGFGYELDYGFSFSIAASIKVQRYIVLHAGFNSKGKDYRVGMGRDILSGMNFGIEFGPIKNIRLTYGYSPMGALGDVHRMEVDYGL